jgi:hypothetical protein
MEVAPRSGWPSVRSPENRALTTFFVFIRVDPRCPSRCAPSDARSCLPGQISERRIYLRPKRVSTKIPLQIITILRRSYSALVEAKHACTGRVARTVRGFSLPVGGYTCFYNPILSNPRLCQALYQVYQKTAERQMDQKDLRASIPGRERRA